MKIEEEVRQEVDLEKNLLRVGFTKMNWKDS